MALAVRVVVLATHFPILETASHCGASSACSALPYGMNFFQKATGRCSDGMLMIDFIAAESGLPLLNPYEDRKANFSHGANFAVAGATALSAEFLAEKMNIPTSITNSSLSVQLDWMDCHFKTTCSPDCPKYLKTSFFVVGEIGDEFNYALAQGRTMDDLRRMVHSWFIGSGDTRIVVPGNFPIGCLPLILTNFRTYNSTAYDEYHCLKDWNIIYGDYYNAYLWLLQNAVTLGKDSTKTLSRKHVVEKEETIILTYTKSVVIQEFQYVLTRVLS
ncbi:hypothetical protein P3S68_010573 [Capsicum galapagoense]